MEMSVKTEVYAAKMQHREDSQLTWKMNGNPCPHELRQDRVQDCSSIRQHSHMKSSIKY